MMSVKPRWKQIVDKHGHRVERMIAASDVYRANWHMTPYQAGFGIRGNSLTESEMMAVEAIQDTFNIEDLRRPQFGVDFIYGNVGFEVKSHEWYELTQRQKEMVRLLEAVFVVVSNGNGQYVDEVMRW